MIRILLTLTLLSCFSVRAQVLNTFAGRYIRDFYSITPASQFVISSVTDMYYRNGNIYLCENEKNALRKLNLSTNAFSLMAGTGVGGYFGDGIAAINAKISPGKCAIDAAGNIYVSDGSNYRVRKISTTGVITTIAGTGISAYTGDGGSALSADLRADGIVLDDSGNIYVGDVAYNVIRKINTAGIITTFATSAGGITLSKDLSGNMYSTYWGVVKKITRAGVVSVFAGTGTNGFSGDGGPATTAQINNAWTTIFDRNGNAYIGDPSNYRIRKVNTAGIITTFAGTGTPGYSGDGGPATAAQIGAVIGICVDTIGNIYFANGVSNAASNSAIRKIDTAGIITTISGSAAFGGDGSTAPLAFLDKPTDVCKDAIGNVYIADVGRHTIRKVNRAGIISTIAGTGVAGNSGDGGAATSALLDQPMGIAVNTAGDVFFADSNRHVIRKIAAGTGIISTIVGTGTAGYSGDGGPASSATISAPIGLAIDNSGNLYISDCGNHCIRKVNMSTNIISTFAGTGGTAGFGGDGSAAAGAQLSSPQYIAFDQFNKLYIADKYNNRIRKVEAGIISTVFGNGTSGAAGDGGLGVSAELCEPTGLAIDDSGGITTTVCGKIRHVPAGGGPVRVDAGAGMMGISANGLGADTSVFHYAMNICYIDTGKLLIADLGNHAVRSMGLFPASIAPVTSYQLSVKLYPNPTTGIFEITGVIGDNVANGAVNCSIRNVLGQEVYTKPMNVNGNYVSATVALDGQLTSGVYCCVITGGGVSQTIVFQLNK